MSRTEYNEQKKIFEQFKKELNKEIGKENTPKFIMSYAQFCNRTATALLGGLKPYEEIIASWKPYAVPESKLYDCAVRVIERAEKDLAEYGTPGNETQLLAEKIVNSVAFKKFSETFGGVRWSTEVKTDCGKTYKYLRFKW